MTKYDQRKEQEKLSNYSAGAKSLFDLWIKTEPEITS